MFSLFILVNIFVFHHTDICFQPPDFFNCKNKTNDSGCFQSIIVLIWNEDNVRVLHCLIVYLTVCFYFQIFYRHKNGLSIDYIIFFKKTFCFHKILKNRALFPMNTNYLMHIWYDTLLFMYWLILWYWGVNIVLSIWGRKKRNE